MNIAIIDADLIGRKKHRFPNLVCMKLSAYYKELGNNVVLKTDYEKLDQYDKVFISKVFTDTPIDKDILNLPNVEYGGTGFYYDKAPKLPYEIEHHMPDYDLYSEWVNSKINNGSKRKEFEYYLDYSIGFSTRGCFRKCEFCVNKNYNKCEKHSPISEFYDKNRKYICLLDDNILAYPNWKDVFEELIKIDKPFQYKQGMDERLLTDEKLKILSKMRYKDDYIFAFDNIKDKNIIVNKLKLLKKYINNRNIKFYVLCGYDRENKWDLNFWKQDIIDTFERIKILMEYGCIPYIMRYARYKESPYAWTYINLASWCNQVSFFKKKSYREFCEFNQNRVKVLCSTMKYLKQLENDCPEIAEKYFDMKFEELNNYKNIKENLKEV